MAMVDVEYSSLQADSRPRLYLLYLAQVSWLDLMVGSCSALFYIHQTNSRNSFTMTLSLLFNSRPSGGLVQSTTSTHSHVNNVRSKQTTCVYPHRR